MNVSLAVVSFSVDDIEARAFKLNTFAQMSSHEVLVGFEPPTFQLADVCLTTRQGVKKL